MKRIFSVIVVTVMLFSSIFIPLDSFNLGTILAENEVQPDIYASFSLKNNSTVVANDPRFSNYATFNTTKSSNEFSLFYNGENDWAHADLTDYIGATDEPQAAYLSFWFRASSKGKFKVRFFHTYGSEYASTTEKEISVTKAAQWQLVNIPMNEFEYTQSNNYLFGRFDIVTVSNTFSNGRLLVSDVNVQSAPGTEYVEAEGVHVENEEISLRVNEYKAINPVFTSSKGENVLPAKMTWTSEDTSIASVDENGVVLGHKEGQVNISGKLGKNTVTVRITVAGVKAVNTVAQFTLNSNQYEVNGDPRFNSIISLPAADKVVLFHNGENDWAHADLSDYINAESDAYVSFWIKSNYKGAMSFNFFHTYNSEYAETVPVKFSYNTPDTWQAVTIPMNEIKYTTSDILVFGRADINLLNGGIKPDEDYIKISPIIVTDSKPVIPVLVEPENMELNYETHTLNAETSFDLIAEFTSSKGTAAPEEVIWKSEDENIATVDRAGHVKALKQGNTIIHCESESGKFKKSCAVTVMKREAAKVFWQMGSSYLYSSNNFSVTMKAADDPRFSLTAEAVLKNNENYSVQFFQNGSEAGDISECIEFGVLRFWVKVPRENTVFTVSLTGNYGSHYTGTNSYLVKVASNSGWQRIEIPLSEFKFSADFEYKYLRFVAFSAVNQADIPTGCFGIECGETLKFAGVEVLNRKPIDAEAPQYDAVQGISFETDYFSVKEGARCKLEPKIVPETADQSFTFINTSEGISVGSDGIVIADDPGIYTVKVLSDASGKSAEAMIEVKPIPEDEETKKVFEVTFLKGQWSDSNSGYFTFKYNKLEATDPNYYRFNRTMSYSLVNAEKYYSEINGEFTMLFGSCVSQDSLDYFKLNLVPYLETATLRFWVKAPRDNIRMMIGFNDYKYNTVKYNYDIEKGGEWQEIQIPIKDIFETNPGFDRNGLMHLIISGATDIAADSSQALKNDEVVEFGYMQVYTKEAPPVEWKEIDNTRYFYDDSDSKVSIADPDLGLPELTDIRFCFDADSFVTEEYGKLLSPSKLISTLDIKAMYVETGRRFDNSVLSDTIQVRISPDHPCFKGISPTKLTYAVVRDGQLTELKCGLKDDCFYIDIDGFETILMYEKKAGTSKKENTDKVRYEKRVTETVIEEPKKENNSTSKVKKKVYRVIKGTQSEDNTLLYVLIGAGILVVAAAAVTVFTVLKKRSKKGRN